MPVRVQRWCFRFLNLDARFVWACRARTPLPTLANWRSDPLTRPPFESVAEGRRLFDGGGCFRFRPFRGPRGTRWSHKKTKFTDVFNAHGALSSPRLTMVVPVFAGLSCSPSLACPVRYDVSFSPNNYTGVVLTETKLRRPSSDEFTVSSTAFPTPTAPPHAISSSFFS